MQSASNSNNSSTNFQLTHPILKEVKQLQKETMNEMKETKEVVDDWCKKTMADLDKKIALIQKEKKNISEMEIEDDSEEEKDSDFDNFLGSLAATPLKDWQTSQLNELYKRITDDIEKLRILQNNVIEQTEVEKNEQTTLVAEIEQKQAKNLEELQKFSMSLIKFQKYFGLSIEKVSQPGKIKFSFCKINPQNPKQIFYFVLGAKPGSSEYEITECVPMIDFSPILAKFNKDTVNFQQFMVEIRKLFCYTVVA